MSYTYEKVSSNKAKFSFTFTAEEFKDAIQKAYLKDKNQISVPGFRKGKAPRKVIENMYGKGIFYEDAVDVLFPKAYEAAVKEQDVNPVDRPEISSFDQMEEGKDLIFSVTVFVYPEVKLGEYKGIEVKRIVKNVTDEDVDARIEQERNKVARSVEITDRALEDGDIAKLDYSGSVDGEKFEGGTAENQALEIGSGSFIPGFESQMIGMNVGEEKDLTVTFPEKYHDEKLAGKEAVFHVKLNAITKEELPALDDDFASEVSDFDTLAEYRADLQKTMQETNNSESDRNAKNEMIHQLAAAAEMDIPNAMIEDQLDDMMQEMSWNMQRQGFSMEQFLKMTNNTAESLRKMYRSQAVESLREKLTVSAVAKAENIEVTEDEVDAELTEYATNMHESLEHLKATMSHVALDSVKQTLANRKAVDFLFANAVITDTEDDSADSDDGEEEVSAEEETAEVAEEKADEEPKA